MNRISTLLLLATCCTAAPALLAQQPTPAPRNFGGPPPPPQRTGRRPMQNVDGKSGFHNRPEDGGGMHIVPAGTWWRNPATIKTLTLTTDQQKRLDDIFRQNRIQLVHLKASLEEAQINLEPLVNANPPDSNKALAEISKTADLRADLEKANAKMLFSLRAVLTADQWTKLQEDSRGHRNNSPMPRMGGGGPDLNNMPPDGSHNRMQNKMMMPEDPDAL